MRNVAGTAAPPPSTRRQQRNTTHHQQAAFCEAMKLLGYPRALPADVLQDRSDFELVAGCLRWLVLR